MRCVHTYCPASFQRGHSDLATPLLRRRVGSRDNFARHLCGCVHRWCIALSSRHVQQARVTLTTVRLFGTSFAPGGRPCDAVSERRNAGVRRARAVTLEPFGGGHLTGSDVLWVSTVTVTEHPIPTFQNCLAQRRVCAVPVERPAARPSLMPKIPPTHAPDTARPHHAPTFPRPRVDAPSTQVQASSLAHIRAQRADFARANLTGKARTEFLRALGMAQRESASIATHIIPT